MAWLLIDNSNTRTKFALGDAEVLHSWRGVLNTSQVTPQSLSLLLADISFHGVIIASVVPTVARMMEDFFAKSGPLHFLTANSPLELGLDYPEPSQIGADRLANSAAVMSRHGTPAIIIDFGTAVTFDVISSGPAYCGGVIAPGLGAMTGYLNQRTALLPVIEPAEPLSAIGKSTIHAMQVGAVIGYRGLVKEIIAKISAEMGCRPKIIATGGDAALIAAGLPEIDAVDPDITLDGLRQVAARVFSSMQ